MPSILELIFYVALASGGLMVLCACLGFLFKPGAVTRGALALAGIGALVICVGLLANFQIKWGGEGGEVSFETAKIIQESISVNTESQRKLEHSIAEVNAKMEEIQKRQAEVDTRLASLTTNSAATQPPEPEPLCTKDQAAELTAKRQPLEQQIGKVKDDLSKARADREKGRFKNASIGGFEITGKKVRDKSFDAAMDTKIDALSGQLSVLESAGTVLESQIAFCLAQSK
jgi:chromosome segregation ATPase